MSDTDFKIVVCYVCRRLVGDVGMKKCPFCGASPFRISECHENFSPDQEARVRSETHMALQKLDPDYGVG